MYMILFTHEFFCGNHEPIQAIHDTECSRYANTEDANSTSELSEID